MTVVAGSLDAPETRPGKTMAGSGSGASSEHAALTECAKCAGWRFRGTVEDGQRAFREHALTDHPGAADSDFVARRRAAMDATR